MIVHILGALGLASVIAWIGLLVLLALPSTRLAVVNQFSTTNKRGLGKILFAHILAAALAALAVLLQLIFLQESPGNLKTTAYPLGSMVLYLLMATGLGGTFLTSLGVLGRIQTLGTYLAGYVGTAYCMLPKTELLSLELLSLVESFLPGLVPLLITSLLMGFAKR